MHREWCRVRCSIAAFDLEGKPAMNTRMLRWIIFIMFGCALGVAHAQLDADGFLDHQAFEKDFADALGEQFEAKKTVPMDELVAQLEKADRHAVKLFARPQKMLMPDVLYQQCRESVVAIGQIYKCGRCNEWHSSVAGGVVLTKDGIIATNFHVIEADEDTNAMGVRTWDGRLLKIRSVLAADEKNDLALIQVDADDLVPAPIADETRVGEAVYVISHPVEHFYTLTEGLVSGKSIEEYHGERRRQVTITADFAKGSSGCPVFNQYGEILGLVRATNATYYDKKKGVPSNIQMVWKYIVPGIELRALTSTSE
jgi:S1-C subfamily serine protease